MKRKTAEGDRPEDLLELARRARHLASHLSEAEKRRVEALADKLERRARQKQAEED